MKKVGVFVFLLVFLFSIVPLAFATPGDPCSAESDCNLGESCTSSVCTDDTVSTNETTDPLSRDSDDDDDLDDKEKIEDAFECLEKKAGDCSGLSTQEIALTIMATPDSDLFEDCVDELESRQSSNNWGNVRDTALAILALQHAGENTKNAEEWILSKSRNPTELIWYLQQDSSGEVECNIKYESNDYNILIGSNKKIDKNAGSCLSRAKSNFWLKVDPDCYERTFKIECDQDFIATLLYKNKNAQTIYVLEGTDSANAFDAIELKVNSKCFGDSSCDYEATAWATLALLQTGHDVEEYIPYVIAMANTNEGYLPKSFIYSLTSYDDYANNLIEDQKLGNYWEAKSSKYNRYYDTSLALLSIGGSSSEKISKSRDALLFSQGSNGCWQNSIRDTAIVLWALTGKSGRSSNSDSGVEYCTQSNFFCIPNSECPAGDNIGDNFYCNLQSTTCCKTENLKSCSDYGGSVCESGTICSGNERNSLDESYCCTGSCEERTDEISQCEDLGYSCQDSCFDSQESIDYSCSSSSDGAICCRSETTSSSEGSLWWLWILVILILTVLGFIAYKKREGLKLWWFKTKSKFKKDKGSSNPNSSPSPRPGMPPRLVRGSRPPRPGMQQRMPPRQMSSPQPPRSRADHPEMNSTFKKLREMAKK